MRKGFLFDLNKCVGCQACVVACQIENHGVSSEPWREIDTYNSFQHPALPMFHFSLACNHCQDPLCLIHCPARAYKKDAVHQTVDHREDRCIGCRYCTWACPYDAPKFILAKGVVEKCTLCKERILDGRKPNCANLCPTGALDFGDIDEEGIADVPGFIDKGIRPGIKIIPLRKNRHSHPNIPSLSLPQTELYASLENVGKQKVTLKEEWSLVLFTLLVALLFGVVASALVRPIAVDPFVFVAVGVAGMMLSAIHLGKKLRAWRAILNVRSSWLSREIVGYSSFLLFSCLSMSFFPTEAMVIVSALLGLVTLICIDMVYAVTEKRPMPGMSSASVTLTGLLFFSVMSEIHWMFIIVLAWKFALYSMDLFRSRSRGYIRVVLSTTRIVVGFVLPLLLGAAQGVSMVAGIFILAAEIINRAEFYLDLEIITPRKQIEKELLKTLGWQSHSIRKGRLTDYRGRDKRAQTESGS